MAAHRHRRHPGHRSLRQQGRGRPDSPAIVQQFLGSNVESTRRGTRPRCGRRHSGRTGPMSGSSARPNHHASVGWSTLKPAAAVGVFLVFTNRVVLAGQ
jgi:hypothetical protein